MVSTAASRAGRSPPPLWAGGRVEPTPCWQPATSCDPPAAGTGRGAACSPAKRSCRPLHEMQRERHLLRSL
eukprot:1066998-Heterocapsa_arctica.AAC.1